MRRRAVLLSPVALLLPGCVIDRPAFDEDEFARRVRDTKGVTTLVTDASPWRVDVDTSLSGAELNRVGEELHGLVVEAHHGLQVKHGLVTADIPPPPGGHLPIEPPPHLGWMRWLEERTDVVTAHITNRLAKVELQPDADALAWTQSLVADDVVDDPEARLDVSSRYKKSSFQLNPGSPEQRENFARTVRATDPLAATLTSLALARGVNIDIAAPGREEAVRAAQALGEAGFSDPSAVQVTIAVAAGPSWRGTLPELLRLLGSDDELVEAINATGATVTSMDEDAIVVEVPDVEAARKVVELISSDSFPRADDTDVSLSFARENASRLKVGRWKVLGALWLDAHASGLTSTRLVDGRGGRQSFFDIDFHQPDNGPDLASPQGYQKVIDVMRRHTWEGDAQVQLSFDDHLTFWSTARGRAQDPYNALSGARQRKPYGWQKDFLKRWDDTATE